MTQQTASARIDRGIPCLKTGKIIIRETQSTYKCVIKNLRWLTVKLELSYYIELPNVFELSIRDVDYAAPIKCRIQSRDGNDVVATFI